jgi:hypothetical protein
MLLYFFIVFAIFIHIVLKFKIKFLFLHLLYITCWFSYLFFFGVPISFLVYLTLGWGDLYENLFLGGILIFYQFYKNPLVDLRKIYGLDNTFLLEVFSGHITIEIIKKPSYDPNEQYIFTSHPHGTWSLSILAYDTLDNILCLKSNCYLAVSKMLFIVPFLREFLSIFHITECSKTNLNKVLSEGKSIAIYPGGEEELVRSTPGVDIIYIKKRNGIFDLAIQNNVPIVPILCYGETDLFDNWNNVPIRRFLKKYFLSSYQFAINTESIFFYLPKKCTLQFVVGDPIIATDIDTFKKLYIDQLELLRKNYPPTDPDRYFEII